MIIPADHLKLIFEFVTKNSFVLFAPVCRQWRAVFGDNVLTDPLAVMGSSLWKSNADLFTPHTIAKYWRKGCSVKLLAHHFAPPDWKILTHYGNIDAISFFYNSGRQMSDDDWRDIATNATGETNDFIQWWVMSASGGKAKIVNNILYAAARCGRMDTIMTVLNAQTISRNAIVFAQDSAVCGAVAGGRRDVLDELLAIGFAAPSVYNYAAEAARSNQPEILAEYIDESYSMRSVMDLIAICIAENAYNTYRFLCERFQITMDHSVVTAGDIDVLMECNRSVASPPVTRTRRARRKLARRAAEQPAKRCRQ